MIGHEKYKDILTNEELNEGISFLTEMANLIDMSELEKGTFINSWKEKELRKGIFLIKEEKQWLKKVCTIWSDSKLSKDEEKIKIFRKVLIKAIKKNGCFFMKPLMIFENDKEIALEAVSNYGSFLGILSKEFQNDKEIVRVALDDYNCR